MGPVSEGTVPVITTLFDKARLFKYFFRSLRKRGFARTVQISAYELWYEHKFGGNTGRVIPIERLDYSAEAKAHAQPYFPSSFLFLREVLCGGQIDWRDRVFVDFGSGMGRAMLFASTLPFSRIIGVELSPSLCEAARRNLERYYRKRRISTPQWTIVNADARLFSIPNDATVFYLYNPFDATIVRSVLDNIVSSLQAIPRKCYVIYANPIEDGIAFKRGFTPIAQRAKDYIIYTYG
jgi:hypothetical protein